MQDKANFSSPNIRIYKGRSEWEKRRDVRRRKTWCLKLQDWFSKCERIFENVAVQNRSYSKCGVQIRRHVT